ncbi:MAG: extracellular solute-binding protein [Thermotogaceae bacterium]|nr:extracellular solute-binding protein [Thermotogaceae bacterium]
MRKLLVALLAIFVVLSFAKTKLVFWSFMVDDKLWQDIYAEFQKEYPDIEVEFTQLSWANGFDKIVTSIAANSAPDLVELGNTWVAQFANDGAIYALTDDEEKQFKDYVGFNTTEYKGKHYGYIWLVGTRAMYYNVDLFIKAGLDPSNPPKTWSEVLVAAKKIDALGDDIYGFGLPAGEHYSPWQQWFLPAVWGNGGKVVCGKNYDKSCFDSESVLEAAKFYQQLSNYAMMTKQADIEKAFGEGKVGMYVGGQWLIGTFNTTYPDLNYWLALIPKPDEGGYHASFAGGEVLAVTKQTKNYEAAKKLAYFLLRSDIAMKITKYYSGVVYPSDPKAMDDPWFEENPIHMIFFKQAEYAAPTPPTPAWPKIEGYICEFVEKIIIDKQDPEALVKEYDKKIQQALDEVANK